MQRITLGSAVALLCAAAFSAPALVHGLETDSVNAAADDQASVAEYSVLSGVPVTPSLAMVHDEQGRSGLLEGRLPGEAVSLTPWVYVHAHDGMTTFAIVEDGSVLVHAAGTAVRIQERRVGGRNDAFDEEQAAMQAMAAAHAVLGVGEHAQVTLQERKTGRADRSSQANCDLFASIGLEPAEGEKWPDPMAIALKRDAILSFECRDWADQHGCEDRLEACEELMFTLRAFSAVVIVNCTDDKAAPVSESCVSTCWSYFADTFSEQATVMHDPRPDDDSENAERSGLLQRMLTDPLTTR